MLLMLLMLHMMHMLHMLHMLHMHNSARLAMRTPPPMSADAPRARLGQQCSLPAGLLGWGSSVDCWR